MATKKHIFLHKRQAMTDKFKNPDTHLPGDADTLKPSNAQSEKEYNEALKSFRELADKNPDDYLPKVAETLNSLGLLHTDTERDSEAEEEFSEALKIYQALADKNPDDYLPKVAETLNNLGLLHTDTDRGDEDEEELGEKLKRYRELAKKNPDGYLPKVAKTLNNLGDLYWRNEHSDDKEACEKVEDRYCEALKIYRDLAEKNPDDYLPQVAETLNNLALLHENTYSDDEAEEEFDEALRIYRELSGKNPDDNLSKVAETLSCMASFYQYEREDLAKAEELAQESLEIYQRMAWRNHAAFDKDVQEAKDCLDGIQAEKKRNNFQKKIQFFRNCTLIFFIVFMLCFFLYIKLK